MIFTDSFINNMLTEQKNLCMNRKITLLINFNRLICAYSYNKELPELTDNLSTLKDVVDLLNENISLYNAMLSDIENNQINSDAFEEQYNSILNNEKEINDILNKIMCNMQSANALSDNEQNTESEIAEIASSGTKNNDKILTNTDNDNSESSTINIDLEDNNILLISEKEGKVFLPYTREDILLFLDENSTPADVENIINSNYVLPIDRFKNPILSRFKEAFYLVRNKENKNALQAIELGLDLAFNSELNPAIISACRNLDELDIYLDCLEENELDKFDLFEIKYEIMPR